MRRSGPPESPVAEAEGGHRSRRQSFRGSTRDVEAMDGLKRRGGTTLLDDMSPVTPVKPSAGSRNNSGSPTRPRGFSRQGSTSSLSNFGGTPLTGLRKRKSSFRQAEKDRSLTTEEEKERRRDERRRLRRLEQERSRQEGYVAVNLFSLVNVVLHVVLLYGAYWYPVHQAFAFTSSGIFNSFLGIVVAADFMPLRNAQRQRIRRFRSYLGYLRAMSRFFVVVWTLNKWNVTNIHWYFDVCYYAWEQVWLLSYNGIVLPGSDVILREAFAITWFYQALVLALDQSTGVALDARKVLQAALEMVCANSEFHDKPAFFPRSIWTRRLIRKKNDTIPVLLCAVGFQTIKLLIWLETFGVSRLRRFP